MNYIIIEIKQSLIISLPILLAGINLPEEPDIRSEIPLTFVRLFSYDHKSVICYHVLCIIKYF